MPIILGYNGKKEVMSGTQTEYPRQHVYVVTDELRLPRKKNHRDIPYDSQNWEREAAKIDSYNARLDVRRIRLEFLDELSKHRMLNMKTVNRALEAQSDTERKSFVRRNFADINDYKRETWAFAYVGGGYFIITVARQHDDDQFIKREGRNIALGRLESQLIEFSHAQRFDRNFRADEYARNIESLRNDPDIPEKVLREIERMLSREEPRGLTITPLTTTHVTDDDSDEDVYEDLDSPDPGIRYHRGSLTIYG